MSDSTLEEMVARMRKLGVTKYVDGNISIELGPEPVPEAPPESEKDRILREQREAREEAERRHKILFMGTSTRPRFKWRDT